MCSFAVMFPEIYIFYLSLILFSSYIMQSKSPKGTDLPSLNALNNFTSQIKKPPHRKNSPINWFPRREILNVVACEGCKRMERPKTYKQWQVRSLRVGFVQLPFDREIVKQATDKVRKLYHKDFLIDEDGQWLLQI